MKPRRLLNTLLHRFGYSLEIYNRKQIIPSDLPDAPLYGGPEDPSLFFHPWNGEGFLSKLDAAVLDHTMLSRQKLYLLLQLFLTATAQEGDVMEAGTCSGGSALLLAREADGAGLNKRFWLLDTFVGHQKIDPKLDGTHIALKACQGKSRAEVAELFKDSRQSVEFVEGLIPATLEQVQTNSICFAHIDVNLYEPTYTSTKFALERLCRGGVIVFDDYNWPATYGARLAIDDACREFGKLPISVPETTQAFLVG